MSDHAGITVSGVAQLRRTLKAAGVAMTDFTAVNKEVAGVVLPVAKADAPIGPPAHGHIANTVRAGATRNQAIIRVGNAAHPYGPAIHWGWFRRHIKPNPWVTKAARDTESEWSEIYFAGLEKIIEQVKGQ
jgi:hypothetical protein